ncbi:MAG: hypothetical protein IJP92_04170 [Lachnospiraceae bacterium]|nr:hypothetical protein [Lachnospiraceae bacterium]
MKAKKKYHWINDDVIIDFPVSKVVAQVMRECERLDLEESMLYQDYADTLDSITKEMYANGHLTRTQWKKFEDRYAAMV